MEQKWISILHVEDEDVDHMALKRFVEKRGLPYKIDRAASFNEASQMLQGTGYDVVLLDYMMPDGTGLDVLGKIKGISSIFLTGSGNEMVAVKAIKGGADDYLIKDPAGMYLELLPVTIENALRTCQLQKEKEKAEAALLQYSAELEKSNRELQEALARVKTLSGLLPICSYCKKVRDDKGYWEQVDTYVMKHTDAEFSHGMCPDCAVGVVKEYEEFKKRGDR